MDTQRSILVSPRYKVSLDADYLYMIDRAPREDFVVRTLAKRAAGEMPLMSGDLVIAGAATRERYPLAREFPLHFRKTYYPGRMFGDPRLEFEHHQFASALIDVPAPIGYSGTTFRSCLLPGTPLDRLSVLGTEPDESNIAEAQKLCFAAAGGLWRLLEGALEILNRLHEGGMVHGDAHLHNFIVCRSPLAVFPIDFELARTQSSVEPETWESLRFADAQFLLKVALYLQCALGLQEGQLADESMSRLDDLVRPAATFRRVISERSFGGVFT